MIIEIEDWRFQIDVDATRSHTNKNALDHCECSYCKNYYEMISVVYPKIGPFLSQFGINIEGPSELLPFEPTFLLACYRVHGDILTWGRAGFMVDGISVIPESGEMGTFLLWVGELELPWIQKELPEEVISPANLPEFLERMREIWSLRYGSEFVFS